MTCKVLEMFDEKMTLDRYKILLLDPIQNQANMTSNYVNNCHVYYTGYCE